MSIPLVRYDHVSTNHLSFWKVFDSFKRWFVTHKVILEYLQQFSKDTQVGKNTKCNTNVINIEKKGVGWLVIATEALHPSGKKSLVALSQQSVKPLLSSLTLRYLLLTTPLAFRCGRGVRRSLR